LLQQLHRDLEPELAAADLIAPKGFDRRVSQLVKGEHLGDFPYLYLDFPKFFSHEEKFTFRTLFWWGHFFVFSWIVQGTALRQYKANLLDHYERLADKGLYLLMTESLWEWGNTSDNLLEIRSDNREAVATSLEARSFLKLHRYIDFDHPAVLGGRVNEAALEAFRLMLPIVRQR